MPASAETNAKHILDSLGISKTLSEVSRETATPEDYVALMREIRALRVDDKTT